LTEPTLPGDISARKPLAVFDVDGTLFRRGLLPALTRRLVDEGVFSEKVREELSRDYYAWVERRGSYENYDNRVVELFQRELKRRPGRAPQVRQNRGGGPRP
jgi:phosphoserine phosphatase